MIGFIQLWPYEPNFEIEDVNSTKAFFAVASVHILCVVLTSEQCSWCWVLSHVETDILPLFLLLLSLDLSCGQHCGTLAISCDTADLAGQSDSEVDLEIATADSLMTIC